METLERWLRGHPLRLSLALAAVVCLCISADGIVSEDAMPFGDGEHYVMRALKLYGFLHTVQLAQFWNVFTLPKQSLAPLHYWLFFLLPQSWASFNAYGVVQVVATYGLMAIGAWQLCRALDRVEWTPALFLLCATQNISIDFSYFYFADVPFMATGMLALAWQMRAWKNNNWRASLLSGVGAGLTFWVKPPNALIFAATYFIAEVARVVLVWSATPGSSSVRIKSLARHAFAVAAGFIPITLAALACGGFQSIIRLINVNEVSDIFATKLECTGLLRFFYFPLCLTFFYHAVAIALIFALAGVAAFGLRKREKADAPTPPPQAKFPGRLLWPLIIAYFVLGEFFSFGEVTKEMRSLLIVLPVMWLVAFWVLEKWKMRAGVVFLASVAYVLCACSQVFNNTFGTINVATQGYQLKNDWLGRLPQPHFFGETKIGMTRHVIELIHEALPNGGKVAVGSEMIFITSESLSWATDHELALNGQSSPYHFQNFLAKDGRCCRSALLNADGVIIYLHPDLQYGRDVFKASNDFVQFSVKTWLPDGTVQMRPIKDSGSDWMWGCFIQPKKPVTDAMIDQALKATDAGELSPSVEFNPPALDQRLSWQECMKILTDWRKKRLGF